MSDFCDYLQKPLQQKCKKQSLHTIKFLTWASMCSYCLVILLVLGQTGKQFSLIEFSGELYLWSCFDIFSYLCYFVYFWLAFPFIYVWRKLQAFHYLFTGGTGTSLVVAHLLKPHVFWYLSTISQNNSWFFLKLFGCAFRIFLEHFTKLFKKSDAVLMQFRCSFDAVLKLHQKWCSFDAVSKGKWCSFDAVSKLHQNCVTFFDHFSSKNLDFSHKKTPNLQIFSRIALENEGQSPTTCHLL